MGCFLSSVAWLHHYCWVNHREFQGDCRDEQRANSQYGAVQHADFGDSAMYSTRSDPTRLDKCQAFETQCSVEDGALCSVVH